MKFHKSDKNKKKKKKKKRENIEALYERLKIARYLIWFLKFGKTDTTIFGIFTSYLLLKRIFHAIFKAI